MKPFHKCSPVSFVNSWNLSVLIKYNAVVEFDFLLNAFERNVKWNTLKAFCYLRPKQCMIPSSDILKGRVIALDKSRNKLSRIRENITRWCLDCVEVYGFDSVHASSPEAQTDGAPPYPPESFDRVLLDAPCSGLGQRPAIGNGISYAEMTSYPALQRQLFEQVDVNLGQFDLWYFNSRFIGFSKVNIWCIDTVLNNLCKWLSFNLKAVDLLRDGGTLVYSTCTVTLEENESVVAWALRTFPCLKLCQQVRRTSRFFFRSWKCSS